MTNQPLSRDQLAQCVGTSVRLRGSDSPVLTLTEVSALQTSGPWESFTAELRSPGGGSLAQGTYELEHDELGAFELFLVPVAPRGASARYEAVFNRAHLDGARTGG